MKIWIIIFSLLSPLLIESGIQKKIHSEEYIIVYESKDIIIKHHYTIDKVNYITPIETDSSKVYRELKYHYDKLSNDYIKFK